MSPNKLSHTVWECKYHLVWIPKYRRKIVYGRLRVEIGKILRRLCEYKGIEIIEANSCRDYIYICVSIPPEISVASIVGYLKGKSAIEIFEKFSKLRRNFRGHHFWARGYYVSTVGLDEAKVRNHIKNQEARIAKVIKEKHRILNHSSKSVTPFWGASIKLHRFKQEKLDQIQK